MTDISLTQDELAVLITVLHHTTFVYEDDTDSSKYRDALVKLTSKVYYAAMGGLSGYEVKARLKRKNKSKKQADC